MATKIPSSVSEIISWIALGFSFPISANLFLTVRGALHPLLEHFLEGKPLPPITLFFAAFPSQTAMIAVLVGAAVCCGGIYLRRFEIFRRYQVLIISIGWTTVFVFLGATMIGVIMPFISIVNGIGTQP